MNLTIKPGAATEDARQIDNIIAEMEEDMAALDRVIKNNIPDRVQTAWSDTVRGNWSQYYTADVPAAMEDIKKSSTNLRNAVDHSLMYDQEQ